MPEEYSAAGPELQPTAQAPAGESEAGGGGNVWKAVGVLPDGALCGNEAAG